MCEECECACVNDVYEGRVTTLCLSMDTVPHSTLHTCTHSHSQHNRPCSHTVPSPLTPHTAPGLHECMHAHTCPQLEVGVAGRGSGGRREEEGSCPYLELHLDLKVGPVDGKQRAVRAGGAQLPGTVGHVPVAVSQEDQRGEGGDLAGEGALVCRGGHRRLHFICTPTHISLPHFVSGVCSWFTHPTHPSHSTHPHTPPHPPPLSLHPSSHSPHPPMFTSTPSTLLVVQYWCSWSQRATLGSEWNRKSLGNLRTISGQQPHTQPIWFYTHSLDCTTHMYK